MHSSQHENNLVSFPELWRLWIINVIKLQFRHKYFLQLTKMCLFFKFILSQFVNVQCNPSFCELFAFKIDTLLYPKNVCVLNLTNVKNAICHFVFKKPLQENKFPQQTWLLNSNGFYLWILCCYENKSFCGD